MQIFLKWVLTEQSGAAASAFLWSESVTIVLRKKCPNKEFFLVRIFPYSVRMWENTDQKKLRIWTLFTQHRSIIDIQN